MIFSRCQGSRPRREPRPTDRVSMTEVVERSVEAAGPLAESRGTTIQLNKSSINIIVLGDRFQLIQVMDNLIENALKYGKRSSSVRLDCSKLSGHSGFEGPVAEISVKDQGPGIEEFHIPRLTERFYRVDRARSQAVEGTGLGLAIVKHIVNRHKGRMTIESELGAGEQIYRVPADCTGSCTQRVNGNPAGGRQKRFGPPKRSIHE